MEWEWKEGMSAGVKDQGLNFEKEDFRMNDVSNLEIEELSNVEGTNL